MLLTQGRDSRKNMTGDGGGGGGGKKVELNPKPKYISILGQFGTLKIHTFKTWYPKK